MCGYDDDEPLSNIYLYSASECVCVCGIYIKKSVNDNFRYKIQLWNSYTISIY